ncbi:hypothetical protein BJ170DRAFT_598183 [Xylariales sp. AK1849]|nr:hypothetical protein BJ170DRAFT_598183 [Xylariales sp. AK1849]
MPLVVLSFLSKDPDGITLREGMTELSAVSFVTTPVLVSLVEDHKAVGTSTTHTAARVVDEDLKTLPPGARGELLATKAILMTDPEGRQWLRTGDTVSVEASGACTVVGRSKDMIKRVDVETMLVMHPDVAQAAVIGISDARWGELIGAFVQRTQTTSTSGLGSKSRDITVWLKKRLAPHKIPHRIFWLGEDAGIPREMQINASGKIVKSELRAIAFNLSE